MTGVEFRDARIEDLRSIIDLISDDDLGRQRELTKGPLADEYRQAFDAISGDPNQLMVVGERHGEVIAYMQISFIPGLSRKGAWRGQLESIRVASHLRGQGIGTAFLRCAIELCRQRDCRLVQLTSDRRRANALRLYEQLGFVASHNGLKLEL
ncbi:MAG: GNAT family N-acetyltransferase [Pseudomonadota bacterium]